MRKSIRSLISICPASLFYFILFLQAHGQHREIDSLENELRRQNDTIRVLTLIKLSGLYQKIDHEKSFALIKEARDMAYQLSFDNGKYNAVKLLSGIYLKRGDMVKALNEAREQLKIAEKTGKKRLIAESHKNLANDLDFLGYTPEALQENLKAFTIYQQIGDQREIGWTLNNMGNYSFHAGSMVEAEKYYQQGLEVFRKLNDQESIAKVLINIGEVKAKSGDFEKSIEYYFEGLKSAEKINNLSTVAYCLMQIAEVYNKMDNDEKAINFYQRAVSSYNRVILEGKPLHRVSKAYCLTGLGQVMLKKRDYSMAQEAFNEALEITKDSDYYPVLARVYSGLAESNEKSGNFKKAFEYQTMHLVAVDSLNARRQKEKVKELQTRFQAKENEMQIAQLQGEKKWNRIYIILLVCLLILGLAVVILFIARFRLRLKKSKEIAKKEQERFETEIRAKELTEKQLRQELEFKISELTTFTLHMIQKNEILDEVKKEVDEIKQVSSEAIRSKINRLLNSINLSQRNDRDWESFKLYFDQVHKGFFDDLKASYPDLNGKDLKLCALLRLNLDTKQIATILDISPDSAKVARHRIRKKIGLTSDDNLYNFLNRL